MVGELTSSASELALPGDQPSVYLWFLSPTRRRQYSAASLSSTWQQSVRDGTSAVTLAASHCRNVSRLGLSRVQREYLARRICQMVRVKCADTLFIRWSGAWVAAHQQGGARRQGPRHHNIPLCLARRAETAANPPPVKSISPCSGRAQQQQDRV